jgi:hypothetical protein
MLLGFDFNGETKTMWLKLPKCEKLLTILNGWIQAGLCRATGAPPNKFDFTIAKICHAFMCIPAGVGLLYPCNWVLKKCLVYIYFHQKPMVLTALKGCQTLHESSSEPTQCHEVTCGWPDYICIVDASGHGVGGIVFGELATCMPTVFRWEWPDNIKTNFKSCNNLGEQLQTPILRWLTYCFCGL